MIEVLVAVASSTARAFGDDLIIREVAHDGVCPWIFWCRVLADVGDVASIGREEDILIRRPHIGRHRFRFNPMLTEPGPKDLSLRSRRIFRDLHETDDQRIADNDRRWWYDVANRVRAER